MKTKLLIATSLLLLTTTVYAGLVDRAASLLKKGQVTSKVLVEELASEAATRGNILGVENYIKNGTQERLSYFTSTYYRDFDKFVKAEGYDLYIRQTHFERGANGDIVEIVIFSKSQGVNSDIALLNSKNILEEALERSGLSSKAGRIDTYRELGGRNGFATQEFVFNSSTDAMKVANFLEELSAISKRANLEGIESVLNK
jgi:hypothetical protein